MHTYTYIYSYINIYIYMYMLMGCVAPVDEGKEKALGGRWG